MDGIPRPGGLIDTKRKLTVAILAGGESRRLGQDKSLLQFSGETLIKRIAERFSRLALETIVITNNEDKFNILDLPVYSDIVQGSGALGGLYTALYRASQPAVALLACDMPFASTDLVTAEIKILESCGKDVVIPVKPEGLEPMHAVYRRKTCLPAVGRALKRGERRLVSWFQDVSVYEMSPEETASYDPGSRAFVNINTLEDLRRAENMDKKEGM